MENGMARLTTIIQGSKPKTISSNPLSYSGRQPKAGGIQSCKRRETVPAAASEAPHWVIPGTAISSVYTAFLTPMESIKATSPPDPSLSLSAPSWRKAFQTHLILSSPEALTLARSSLSPSWTAASFQKITLLQWGPSSPHTHVCGSDLEKAHIWPCHPADCHSPVAPVTFQIPSVIGHPSMSPCSLSHPLFQPPPAVHSPQMCLSLSSLQGFAPATSSIRDSLCSLW